MPCQKRRFLAGIIVVVVAVDVVNAVLVVVATGPTVVVAGSPPPAVHEPSSPFQQACHQRSLLGAADVHVHPHRLPLDPHPPFRALKRSEQLVLPHVAVKLLVPLAGHHFLPQTVGASGAHHRDGVAAVDDARHVPLAALREFHRHAGRTRDGQTVRILKHAALFAQHHRQHRRRPAPQAVPDDQRTVSGRVPQRLLKHAL